MSVCENSEKAPQKTSSSEPILEKLCFLCNDAATLPPCTTCFNKKALPKDEIPAYCGQHHKDLHWTSGHDKSCGKKALKLGWKEVRGTEGVNNGLPYYVATKELEPGHDIFTKKPLFTFPKEIEQQDFDVYAGQFPKLLSYYFLEEKLEVSVCISCNELMLYGELMEDPLNGIRLNKCPCCGWPVHSPRDVNLQKQNTNDSCQKEHEKECKIFLDNALAWDTIDNMKECPTLSLGALRVVLNEGIKKKLLQLPASTQLNVYLEPIQKFVRKDCKQAQVSEEELNKIIRILWLNSLPSSAGYFSMWKKYSYTIYQGGHTGRILPHNCNPNCSIYVNPKTGEATFKTRRKVGPDEMLTINYLVDAFPQPIYHRALSLMKNNLIDLCECDRCKDGQDLTSAMRRVGGAKKRNKGCSCKYLMPYANRLQDKEVNKKEYESLRSEQGTSKSVLDTPNANKQGHVSPDPSNLYIWQCESCKSLGPTLEQCVVHQKVERTRKELNGAFFGRKYDELKEIIKKYSDEEFHPDHSIMLLGHVALGYLVVEKMNMVEFADGDAQGDSTRLDVHKYFPDLGKAVEILNRIDHGQSEMRGTFLYHHALLKMRHLAQKLYARKKKPNSSDLEVQTYIDSINSNLEESWEIIKNNPHLSAIKINREILLLERYSKDLECICKGLVPSSQEYIFEKFRSKQITSLQTKLASPLSPPSDSGYLYQIKSKVSLGSLKQTDTDVPESGENAERSIGKIELNERINVVSGDFMRELLLPADE